MAITKSLALRKLGIEPKALLSVPQITPMLTEIAQGLTDRGLPSDPYYYLNASSDLEARGLMAVYNQSWKQVRDVLPLEAFCVASGVDPNRILDCIIKSIERLNALSAAVKLSVSQGEVVDATVNAAKDIDNGHKDRRLHMQVSGLMPMPRGARTVVNVQTSANATAAPVQAVIAAPSPEQTIKRLSERLHAVRAALPAEVQKVEDAVVVDEE
jgi:hypothetical protein